MGDAVGGALQAADAVHCRLSRDREPGPRGGAWLRKRKRGRPCRDRQRFAALRIVARRGGVVVYTPGNIGTLSGERRVSPRSGTFARRSRRADVSGAGDAL